jgi:ribosome-binding protein aMBF1 (putative translation factor)
MRSRPGSTATPIAPKQRTSTTAWPISGSVRGGSGRLTSVCFNASNFPRSRRSTRRKRRMRVTHRSPRRCSPRAISPGLKPNLCRSKPATRRGRLRAPAELDPFLNRTPRRNLGCRRRRGALEQDPIAAAILKARMRAGLTQQQLADRLHTDQGNIARLERNRSQATVRTLKRVAEATGHELVVNFRRSSNKR